MALDVSLAAPAAIGAAADVAVLGELAHRADGGVIVHGIAAALIGGGCQGAGSSEVESNDICQHGESSFPLIGFALT